MVEKHDEYVMCKLCSKKFKRLSRHLWAAHKIRPDVYKTVFGGELISEQSRQKQRKNFLGRKHTQATKDLISRNHKEMKLIGDKSPTWKGGCRVHMKYGTHWIDISNAIRERDNYRCRLCGRTKPDGNINFHVHHIDFNGRNNDIHNLITLCSKCHSKIHFLPLGIEYILKNCDSKQEIKEMQKKLIAMTFYDTF